MNRKSNMNNTEKLPTFISVQEFRDYMQIGNERAYNLVKMRSFPSIKIGNKFYVNKDELPKWFEKQYTMKR